MRRGSVSAGRDYRLPGLFAHRVRFRVGVIDAMARGVPPKDAVQILELKIPVAGVLTRHLPLVIRGRDDAPSTEPSQNDSNFVGDCRIRPSVRERIRL